VTAKLADVMFLPLVARLANEPSPKARAQVAAALKLLHQQLDGGGNDALAAFCRRWLQGAAAGGARRAAAQALGLLAEAEGLRFRRRLAGSGPADGGAAANGAAAAKEGEGTGGASGGSWLLSDAARLLRECAAAAELSADAGDREEEEEEGGDGAAAARVPRWQEAYHLLLMLEKVAAAAGMEPLAWDAGEDVRCLWGAVVGALLHPHLWVRKASARLVGAALAAPDVRAGLLGGVAVRDGAAAAGACGSWGGTTPGELALALYMQMESDVVDEALCGQTVKCLVSLAVALAAEQPEEGEQEDAAAAAAAAEEAMEEDTGTEEQDGEEEAGSSGEGEGEGDAEEEVQEPALNGASAGDSSSEGGQEDEEEEGEEAGGGGGGGLRRPGRPARGGPCAITLRGLVLRMVKLAEDGRVGRRPQRLAALRWLAAAASAAGPGPLRRHLPLMLRPLYRISEAAGASTRNSAALPAEARELGEEVLAHMRDVFGADAMLAAYNAAREGVRVARLKRKRGAALRAMVDPEAAARQKLKRNARKAAGRKKKMEEKKRRRTAKGSAFGTQRARGGGGGGKRGGSGAGGGRGGKRARH
jgi:U3 small nucleolar RNA-associated protein 20